MTVRHKPIVVVCVGSLVGLTGCDPATVHDDLDVPGPTVTRLEDFSPLWDVRLPVGNDGGCPTFLGYDLTSSFEPITTTLDDDVVLSVNLRLAQSGEVGMVRASWYDAARRMSVQVEPGVDGSEKAMSATTMWRRETADANPQTVSLRGTSAVENRYAEELLSWAKGFVSRCAPV